LEHTLPSWLSLNLSVIVNFTLCRAHLLHLLLRIPFSLILIPFALLHTPQGQASSPYSLLLPGLTLAGSPTESTQAPEEGKLCMTLFTKAEVSPKVTLRCLLIGSLVLEDCGLVTELKTMVFSCLTSF
jgi:hypothetical protein